MTSSSLEMWRTNLLRREVSAGRRLLPERRLFNTVLRAGGRRKSAKAAKHRSNNTSTVVVNWGNDVSLKDGHVPSYPEEKLREWGWTVKRKGDETRQVLQGPANTQKHLLALLRSAWKDKMHTWGNLVIATIDEKRRKKCKACLKKYGSSTKKKPSRRSGGALWCRGTSRWNRYPAARPLGKRCSECVRDFCVCTHVGAKSGRRACRSEVVPDGSVRESFD